MQALWWAIPKAFSLALPVPIIAQTISVQKYISLLVIELI